MRDALTDIGSRRDRARRASGVLLAAGLPLLLTSLLAAVWVQSSRLRLFGDEPHYVIIAESLMRDGDFELRNNYALEARDPTHVGEVDPHIYEVGHRWYSLHGPGLGFLIGPALGAAGVLGARLTTCALAALLPLTMYLWLQGLLGRGDATWLTLAGTLSVPYVFGAVHLYPDPVAAAMAAPLLLLLAAPADGRRRPGAWAAFWLAAGLLPLLMVKFLAPAILLAVFALVSGPMRRGTAAERDARLATSPLFLAGPLMLAAYHLATFGGVLGPRGAGDFTSDVNQALMVFLGLHLDQAQGMFLQQPLLLAGVPALGVMAVRRPWLGAAWCLLYASLLVPNSLQVIPFGGASPSGRFAWPAAWLWMVPLALTLSWRRGRTLRAFRPALLALGAYQAALALRWVASPMAITNAFTPELALRNSLFPVGMRAWLPSFYSADFLSFPPNIVAIAALALLLASGPVLGVTFAGPRQDVRPSAAGPP